MGGRAVSDDGHGLTPTDRTDVAVTTPELVMFWAKVVIRLTTAPPLCATPSMVNAVPVVKSPAAEAAPKLKTAQLVLVGRVDGGGAAARHCQAGYAEGFGSIRGLEA